MTTIEDRITYHVERCAATSTATERRKWAAFYPDAHAWILGLAGEWAPDDIPRAADRVADCCAALSPLKPWDTNRVMTERALEYIDARDALASAVVPTDPNLPRHWAAEVRGLARHVGAMHARAEAALGALLGRGPGTGPKVSAFAANLRGDYWSRVTIDRHMLAMFLPDVSPTPKRVADVEAAVLAWWNADPLGLSGRSGWTTPAETQATLWGWWRREKGLKDY